MRLRRRSVEHVFCTRRRMRTKAFRVLRVAILFAAACGASRENDANEGRGSTRGPGDSPPSSISSEPAPGTSFDPGPGGPPQVQLIGRFDTTNPNEPEASWPGVRIVTRFFGTSVSVTLREHIEDWMDGGPSYWDVSIDRAPPTALAMIPDEQPHVFDLAKDLAPGEHEVELYKRSEMQTGMTRFLGFDFHGGRALPPPPRLPRHIEVMADSYGTGYGIETLGAPNLECMPPPNHAGRHQNFRKSYGALLGERFGAEVEGTVYSGKGLTRGIWPTDTDGLIEYYNRANPNPAIANNPPLFDLKSWIPDAIILAQGTVDNGIADWRNVYRDFVVNQLRARAPNAHIFLVVPGHVVRDKFIAMVTSVEQERIDAGDTKVHAVIPAEEEPEEMTGCGYHGSPVFHARVAKTIGDVMAEKMGW
jgi:hypothetical protein